MNKEGERERENERTKYMDRRITFLAIKMHLKTYTLYAGKVNKSERLIKFSFERLNKFILS